MKRKSNQFSQYLQEIAMNYLNVKGRNIKYRYIFTLIEFVQVLNSSVPTFLFKVVLKVSKPEK